MKNRSKHISAVCCLKLFLFTILFMPNVSFTQLCSLGEKEFQESINSLIWSAYTKADSTLNVVENLLVSNTCDNSEKGHLLNIKAIAYLVKGNYEKCIVTGHDMILLGKKINDPYLEAMGNSQISAGYINLEKYDKANKYAHEQISSLKKTKKRRETCWAYYNLSANLYNYFPDSLSKAINYLNIAETYVDSNDYNMRISLKTMSGLLHAETGHDELAKREFHAGLRFCELSNHNGTIASMYGTYATYLEEIDFDSSLIMYDLSNAYYEKDFILNGVSGNYLRMGDIYLQNSKLFKAIEMYKNCILYADLANSPVWKVSALEKTHQVYVKQNNYKDAYFTLKDYYRLKDSVSGIDIKNQIEKREIAFNYEKKAAADSVAFEKEKLIADAEIAEQNAELKAKRNQQYALFGGLTLVLLFAWFMFNRFKITSEQKKIIEGQKEIVELAHHELKEKNQEILDSITYAKRIQSAILPPNKLVKEFLEESFVLYLPKDIVAGDFYWMESVKSVSQTSETKDKVLFAAADCTGHGVPGAMVSVVCNNGLNRSVREFGLTDPGQILDKTRELVIQEFEKSEDEVKDGMDISLVSIEYNSEMKTDEKETIRQVKWAGANNPLWVIRGNTGELEEIKANKQPIGKYSDPHPFTSHSLELKSGDKIYIFTDGYQDQFGGAKGKKFKSSNLKELLVSIRDQNMDNQKEIIYRTFQDWKGTLEQIDDICIIGVSIS